MVFVLAVVIHGPVCMVSNIDELLNRTITVVVALATLTSNVLSSLLFHRFPDDPYHLARNYGWYLHFANVLSVFGFIGSVRVRAPILFHSTPSHLAHPLSCSPTCCETS